VVLGIEESRCKLGCVFCYWSAGSFVCVWMAIIGGVERKDERACVCVCMCKSVCLCKYVLVWLWVWVSICVGLLEMDGCSVMSECDGRIELCVNVRIHLYICVCTYTVSHFKIHDEDSKASKIKTGVRQSNQKRYEILIGLESKWRDRQGNEKQRLRREISKKHLRVKNIEVCK